eukprot:s1133_g18.t1
MVVTEGCHSKKVNVELTAFGNTPSDTFPAALPRTLLSSLLASIFMFLGLLAFSFSELGVPLELGPSLVLQKSTATLLLRVAGWAFIFYLPIFVISAPLVRNYAMWALRPEQHLSDAWPDSAEKGPRRRLLRDGKDHFGMFPVFVLGNVLSLPTGILLVSRLGPAVLAKKYAMMTAPSCVFFPIFGFATVVAGYITLRRIAGVWIGILMPLVLSVYEFLGTLLVAKIFMLRFLTKRKVRESYAGTNQGVIVSMAICNLHALAEGARLTLLYVENISRGRLTRRLASVLPSTGDVSVTVSPASPPSRPVCSSEFLPTIQWKVDHILSELDVKIATALFHFRALGRQVTVASRCDDIRFYNALAADSAQWLEPQHAQRFWKALRRNLPKFRTRRIGHHPLTIETLEDQWLPFFSELETGFECTPHELTLACHARQMAVVLQQKNFTLEDLPSIVELEDALRTTQPHRATGYDPMPSELYRQQACLLARHFYPLVIKMMVWASEPVGSKGGQLAVLHKKGSRMQVSNYRGIMLLQTLSKRFHAMIRTRIMGALHRRRPPGQLGGFPNQQVCFGSQAMLTFGRLMDKANVTSAILFVDLTTAFHRLIREWVSGVHVPEDVQAVLESLDHEGISIADMIERLHEPTLLERLQLPPFLQQLMRDIHSGTWFTVGSTTKHIAVTRRGTRPGSPLADCIFHVLMASIQEHLNSRLTQQEEFVGILQEVGIHIDSITWADDLAVPIATRSADSMPDKLRQLLTHVNALFRSYGFTLNMDRGKTSAVVTFRGTGAPLMRKTYQLCDKPGDTFEVDGQWLHLHYVPVYKHLGTIFSAKHTLDEELQSRMGLAHSAFGQIARQILCNKHLPEATRLQLFQLLISSKLFFGLGAWPTPSVRQLDRLKAFLLRLLRKVLRLKPSEVASTSQAAIFTRARQPAPRVKLAVDRLLYAKKLWEHGPEFLQHMLHCDAVADEGAWLSGLKVDLMWMAQLEPEGLNISPDGNLTELIDYWQAGARDWETRVKRALRRYTQQENMMAKMHHYHRVFFRSLREGGATFLNNADLASHEGHVEFTCFCQRSFTTAQGLATHKRLAHGVRAIESVLIDGVTCPCCLKFLWSRQRLYQHLSYVSRKTGVNACFQRLCRQGFTATSDPQLLDACKPVRGLNRVDALQAFGPLPEDKDIGLLEVADVKRQIERLQRDLVIDEIPENVQALEAQLLERLDHITLHWFRNFQAQNFDKGLADALPDEWLSILADFDAKYDSWIETVLLAWGECCLPDVCATFEDGEAEFLVDSAFCELAADLPRSALLSQLSACRLKLCRLQADVDQPFSHRPVRRGTANARERIATAQRIPSLFDAQTEWFADIGRVRWDALPKPVAVGATIGSDQRPHFLIAHLFSGRRRQGDFHERLEFWARRYNFGVTILSLDTAVSVHYGNLVAEHVTWGHLVELYRAGRIAATLCGSPCETFSAARYHQPSEEECRDRSWPRPLRSAAKFLGLEQLTRKELRQLQQGSEFFFQCVIAVALTLSHGGLLLSEHPWRPADPALPSIWSSVWMKLLLLHPDVCLHRVAQWKWGAPVRKPTGLLAVRLPQFSRSMYGRQCPDAREPAEVAIGKDEQGRFRTSALKEYPSHFSDALAGTIADQLRTLVSTGDWRHVSSAPPETEQWLAEAAAATSTIRESAVWLPDYQGTPAMNLECYGGLWQEAVFCPADCQYFLLYRKGCKAAALAAREAGNSKSGQPRRSLAWTPPEEAFCELRCLQAEGMTRAELQESPRPAPRVWPMCAVMTVVTLAALALLSQAPGHVVRRPWRGMAEPEALQRLDSDGGCAMECTEGSVCCGGKAGISLGMEKI